MSGRLVPARLLLALVRGYQRFISPLLPPRCRFYPSCSEYTAQAVARHGLIRGAVLAVRRIMRCHPFHRGGYDPVPPRRGGLEDAGRQTEQRNNPDWRVS